MNILIIGGAGMVGQKLAQRLSRDGHLGDRLIGRLTLHDVVEARLPDSPFPVQARVGDLSDEGQVDALLATKPDVVFHLAAIVSGEAETDFDKGYRVNVDGTWKLFKGLRRHKLTPRVVFTSSIAVFGAPFPDEIPDDFLTAPLTSYGTQKAIGELLLADYTRKGFFDGVGIRLPTICVRPGAPNKAASGFFSTIIREPLAGKRAVLPVSEEVRHWHASPRAAVEFLIHAATMDTARIGPRRNLTMPGLACTVGEQIAALREVAGEAAVQRIDRVPDPAIERIVAGWARGFDARRARELGFEAEKRFSDIVRVHIEDELGGRLPTA
jgi:nucleoside-diphosphate-sugar epimerase